MSGPPIRTLYTSTAFYHTHAGPFFTDPTRTLENTSWSPELKQLPLGSPVVSESLKYAGEQMTDSSSPPPVVSSSAPPTLPPSVEAAYKIKCIALKKRLIEIEAQNDATRERVVRTERGIRKLRLERAILLTRLSEIISKNGEDVDGVGNMYDGNSEGSSEGPPT
ncbi:MAG: hypothetical protein Q9184_007980, partial [Pyrenodesmia sp. 2 TL-2023]